MTPGPMTPGPTAAGPTPEHPTPEHLTVADARVGDARAGEAAVSDAALGGRTAGVPRTGDATSTPPPRSAAGPATRTPYRSRLPAGRDGFAQLVHAEWTKFRTVRGWVIGLLVAIGLSVLVSLLGPLGSSVACRGPHGETCDLTPPTRPGGQPVTDRFSFVHQPLVGNGSITVRMTSLTGVYRSLDGPGSPGDGSADPPASRGDGSVDQGAQAERDGTQPWSKAGIIIKESTAQGSAYAAMMVTGSNGVRMQYDYTHDRAGLPGAVSAASPRWLRLNRVGDTITGYDSVDGRTWTTVGTARLSGLASTVQAGLFAASPDYVVTTDSFGGSSSTGGSTQATGRFDTIDRQGDWPRDSWTGDTVDRAAAAGGLGGLGGLGGGPRPDGSSDVFTQDSGAVTVTGTGDIGPYLPDRGSGKTLADTLVGTFAGLIAVLVVATMFMTAEYRRGVLRATFTASPRRGRVLAAKAVVVSAVTFVAGLVTVGITIPIVERLERGKGLYVVPTPPLTELRVIVGTAGLLAVAAVLALGVGAVLRRGAGAATAVIVLIVVPYILAVASVLPVGPARWLLRVTPAAAFAVQQSSPQYAQVISGYTPNMGYFPLAPWAGFAVLCGYTVAVLLLAARLLRRRDA